MRLPKLYSFKISVLSFSCSVLSLSAVANAEPDKAFRLNNSLPDYISVSGESRIRYEALDGQFRAGGTGSDQLLLARTLIHTKIDTGPLKFGLELQDSRTYLDDAGTPNSSSITNPLDILQFYAQFTTPGLLGADSNMDVKLGRQTVTIGAKRQIDRASFANVIKAYTGIHATSKNKAGDELHLLYVVPIDRNPANPSDLDDNNLSGDTEEWERRFWGIHYRRANAFPEIASNLTAEAFLYGLNEEDTASTPTPNRQFIEPGFRLARKPQTGQWDMEIETSWRTGTHRGSSSPTATTDLDFDAQTFFSSVGYTFNAPWQPRIAAQYFHTSGDEDPTDAEYNQYEYLFGSRRTDLNNTSIYGPFSPANLTAIGTRIQVKPSARWDARLTYNAGYLSSDTDTWIVANQRDITGQSGDFIGHTFDSSIRYWVVPDSLRLETGGSIFIKGDFAKNAPNASNEDETFYGYTSFIFSF
ncbi:alginate export family protein [Hirschia litorea]|uniref:Alginate export family protein n=1 Tax=Hirschia litorea TaxID=1199156 RepID=A0ABW2IP55_9PROT